MDDPISAPPEIEYARKTEMLPAAQVIGYAGLKLFGLYMLAQAIPVVVYLLAVVITGEAMAKYMALVQFGGVGVIFGCIGVLLLLFAKQVAVRIFTPIGGPIAGPSVDQGILLISVAAGLFTVVSAVPAVASGLIGLVMYLRENQGVFSGAMLFDQGGNSLVERLLHLGIGLFLFFRPGWIVGQFRKRSEMPV